MTRLSVHPRHLIYVVGLMLACSKHDVTCCIYACVFCIRSAKSMNSLSDATL